MNLEPKSSSRIPFLPLGSSKSSHVQSRIQYPVPETRIVTQSTPHLHLRVLAVAVVLRPNQKALTGTRLRFFGSGLDTKKHISISILKGYLYLMGLQYKGVYMGYRYPSFCFCAFLGPGFRASGFRVSGFKVAGLRFRAEGLDSRV